MPIKHIFLGKNCLINKELTDHDERLAAMIKKVVELEINVRILESFEVHGLTTTELPSDEQEIEERNKIEP